MNIKVETYSKDQVWLVIRSLKMKLHRKGVCVHSEHTAWNFLHSMRDFTSLGDSSSENFIIVLRHEPQEITVFTSPSPNPPVYPCSFFTYGVIKVGLLLLEISYSIVSHRGQGDLDLRGKKRDREVQLPVDAAMHDGYCSGLHLNSRVWIKNSAMFCPS